MTGEANEAKVRVEVARFHGRYALTVKVNGAVMLADKFEDFCELDTRMRGRLGVLWETFRDEVRAVCDR